MANNLAGDLFGCLRQPPTGESEPGAFKDVVRAKQVKVVLGGDGVTSGAVVIDGHDLEVIYQHGLLQRATVTRTISKR